MHLAQATKCSKLVEEHGERGIPALPNLMMCSTEEHATDTATERVPCSFAGHHAHHPRSIVTGANQTIPKLRGHGVCSHIVDEPSLGVASLRGEIFTLPCVVAGFFGGGLASIHD